MAMAPSSTGVRVGLPILCTLKMKINSFLTLEMQPRLREKSRFVSVYVVTKYGHSFPKLVCPDGENGLVISTMYLNKVLNVDPTQETMTVQSGMMLNQFIDEAAKVGLALPYSPYWAGLTVGGMISTGSHGSSLRGLGSAVHDYVVGLTMVSPGGRDDGYVKVRRLGVGDDDLQAVKVSLGVLGVISQVRFKLQPLFKRNLTFTSKSDSDLGDIALTFGEKHEFGDMVWLPSQRKVIYRIDDRVPVTTPGNGVYKFSPMRSVPRFVLESVRAAEDLEESLGLDSIRCSNAKAFNAVLFASAYGLTNDDYIFTGYPVIGYHNKIQAFAGCLDDSKSSYCGWDPRIKGEYFYSNGFAVPLSKVKSFIQDIQKLVNEKPTSLCGVEMYNGILMRYVTKSPAYLGKDEDGIDFDITYYRSRKPLGPRLYDDILSEIEQMAVFKYNALPHWGKNRNVAFEGVISKYKDSEPVKCSNGNSNCTVNNGYASFPDRSSCRAADVVYPVNEDQLISYVRGATKIRRKIKVVTKYCHSFTKLVCPDGQNGLVISTKNLNKVLNVDPTQKTMTVQSGMILEQFKDEAAKVGLALPYSPYWAGVSIGGMISTASHGSSLRGLGSAVHDYIVGLTIVSPGDRDDSYVKVRRLSAGDDDLQAVKVSLGVLGVISQVTFKLQPLFKRNLTYTSKNDSDLGDIALTFGKKHEFGDMVWLPSQRKVIYRIDDRVPVTTPGNGVYKFSPLGSVPRSVLESVRAAEEIEESMGLDSIRCSTAKKNYAALVASAFGLTNDDHIFTGYPVIGYHNKIQASAGCLDGSKSGYCGWDPRIRGEYFYNNGYAIPLSKVKSFIQDIQKLVDEKPTSLCSLEMYGGILVRYVKKSSAYLGKDEDGIDFDITYYRPREYLGPRLDGDVLDEIEQIAIFKYNALPHWGKNRNVAFQGVINKYKGGNKFLEVKKKYDPLGLFSSEWTDQILGLKGGVTIKKVGCGREGLCICTDDTDCGPGYSCQTGRVYTMAKVCRKIQ
ncbi:hypothetical protein KSS87_011485 [Heliosperma pusillum]|nr:hypothetical protein KSS87_011485 [Heliosperma pusillum]